MNARYLMALLLGCVVATWSCAARANNNLFLPGDAFFPTLISEEAIEKLQAATVSERRFAYSTLGGYEPAFCGYAGYFNAIIPSVDNAFLDSLAAVCKRMRQTLPDGVLERDRGIDVRMVSIRGVGVLFYADPTPRDLVWGLRYNEGWVEEAAKFGHRRASLRLCCLVPKPRAVETSWRDSGRVPALAIELPNAEPSPKDIALPILVQGPVRAIVIGAHKPGDFFHPNDAQLSYCIVTKAGVEEHRRVGGEWTEVVWRADYKGRWRPPISASNGVGRGAEFPE